MNQTLTKIELPDSFKPDDFRTVAEIDAEIARLQNEKRLLWPKTVKLTVALNTDYSAISEMSDEFGFSYDEAERFERVCKELDVTIHVENDGSAWIIELGGAKLERKIAAN